MRHAKHRRPTFAERHEADLIVLMVALIGILMGIVPWLAF